MFICEPDGYPSLELFTVKTEEAYHLCSQHSTSNRIFIGFCFPCMKNSLNIFIHSGFQRKETPIVILHAFPHQMQYLNITEVNNKAILEQPPNYEKLFSNNLRIYMVRFIRFGCPGDDELKKYNEIRCSTYLESSYDLL